MPWRFLSWEIVVSNHACPYGGDANVFSLAKTDDGSLPTIPKGSSEVEAVSCSSVSSCSSRGCGCFAVGGLFPKASNARLQAPGLLPTPHRSSQKRSPFGEVITGNPTSRAAAPPPLPSLAVAGRGGRRRSSVHWGVFNNVVVVAFFSPARSSPPSLAVAPPVKAPLA